MRVDDVAANGLARPSNDGHPPTGPYIIRRDADPRSRRRKGARSVQAARYPRRVRGDDQDRRGARWDVVYGTEMVHARPMRFERLPARSTARRWKRWRPGERPE